MSKLILYHAGDDESHKELGRKLRALEKGDYILEIKKKRNVRSLSANRYYHAILNIICIETGIEHDDLHEAMKAKFNSKVLYLPDNETEVIGQSTSKLDTAEFASYVNRVKHYGRESLGCIIPEAGDIDQQRWMEIENAYDDNFKG